MIRLTDISFGYGDIPVLNHINYEIQKGETVLLEGPNGCGKSTLMQLLNGLIFADSGTYFLDGEEVTEKKLKDNLTAKKFHSRIGYLFQRSDTQLFNASVAEEIAFGPRAMKLPEAEIEERVTDCMKMLHIENLRERTPYHLSGGEQKKVAFASILVTNPDVYILDEPFNNLDVASRDLLLSIFQSLRQNGKTMLIAAHGEESIRQLADRSWELLDKQEAE